VANERLRDALLRADLGSAEVADTLGVDAKTVERWMTQNRTPYARHRTKLAALVGLGESYLWPAAVPPERQVRIAGSEIVTAYPHRRSVPTDLWDELLQGATDRVDVLVHAGQFLAEQHDIAGVLATKARRGVTVRLNFGRPGSTAVEQRSTEEGLGTDALSARIRYGLTAYRPLQDVAGIEFRFHETTLYNSIFRFDEQMIVNMHVYGVAGAHAPALHLRRLGSGDLFDTYARSFIDVWTLSEPAAW
jgi:transcriptional regulator with XRE-family HTH domain